MSVKIKQTGMTLPEVLLVLALAAMIMVFGLRQFALYQADSDRAQLEYNINSLFQAMTQFYQANCNGYFIPGPPRAPAGGRLFIHAIQNRNTTPPPPYPINLETDLIANGYLSAKPSFNSLVNSATPDLDYVSQFNEYPTVIMENNTKGTVLTWKIQIAVLLKNQAAIGAYQSLLNANCISDLVANNNPNSTPSVNACRGNTAPSPQATYLVFERLPAISSEKQVSTLSASMPGLTQFKQLYSVSPKTYLISTSHNPEYQYFNCGS